MRSPLVTFACVCMDQLINVGGLVWRDVFLFRFLLQVVEMYSSGGDLHLELPTGQQGGTGKLWVSYTSLCLCGVSFWFAIMAFTHAHLLPSGDPSFWDKGGDESQLLVERRGQPHGFHQNQNQRPQWGPVHHPPCRGGSHVRCATKALYIHFIVKLRVLLFM